MDLSGTSPLWALLREYSARACGLDDDDGDDDDAAAHAATFRRMWAALAGSTSGSGDLPATVPMSIVASGLPMTIPLHWQEAWDVYVPLVLLTRAIHGAQQAAAAASSAAAAVAAAPARTLIGLCGPAGSGKTTLAALLTTLGEAWVRASERHDASGAGATRRDGSDTAATPAFGCLSMDAYHRYNADLDASGLRHVKGALATMDGRAFAADLAAVKRHEAAVAPAASSSPAAAAAAAAAVPRHTGAFLASATGNLMLPDYDRLVTHDPAPGAIALLPPPAHAIMIVEGLYLCAGSRLQADAAAPDAAAAPAASGGASEGAGSTAAPASASASAAAVAADWCAVRDQLDAVLFLDVPLATCRERALRRKTMPVATPGPSTTDGGAVAAGKPRMTMEAAAAYFERVDAPIYAALQADKGAPVPHALVVDYAAPGLAASDTTAASATSRSSAVPGGTGPEFVISLGTTPPDAVTGNTRIVCTAAEMRGLPALVRPPAAVPARASTPVERLVSAVVLGLNPCMQRTMVFGTPPTRPAAAAAGTTCATAAGGSSSSWKRGGVNRATSAMQSVGGKGQHFAIAFARAAAHAHAGTSAGTAAAAAAAAADSSAGTSIMLHQFLGGSTGEWVGEQLATTAAAVAAASPAATSAAIVPRTVRLADGQPTRCCVTLLDMASAADASGPSFLEHEMTELIEPSARVTPEQAASLLENVARDAASWPPPSADGAAAGAAAAAAVAAAGMPVVAIMGSAPPGAEGVYLEALTRIAAHASATASGATPSTTTDRVGVWTRRAPFVLVDVPAGTLPLLRTGAVDVLKVNGEELAKVAGEAASASGGAVAKAAHAEGGGVGVGVAADALTVFRALLLLHAGGSAATAAAPPRLPWLAVTNGPGKALLFHGRSRSAALVVTTWQYDVPRLDAFDLRNPIGAGDTVSANLGFWVARGDPLPVAFKKALAAGTASCMTFVGAQWAAEDASNVGARIAVRQGVRVVSIG